MHGSNGWMSAKKVSVSCITSASESDGVGEAWEEIPG